MCKSRNKIYLLSRVMYQLTTFKRAWREKTEKHMVSLFVCNSWLFICYLHSKEAQHW